MGIPESENVRKFSKKNRSRIVPVAALFLAATMSQFFSSPNSGSALLSPQIAEAQNFGQRTIQGKVLSDTESPVSGATVFLRNAKNRNVKSFTSTADGSFRFAQVGMVDDYEVWAEMGKKKSGVKTASSFDSRKQLDFELKLK
jgi:Carboxypeptidase regulatory-like domain